jgi:hypothetical protein
VTDSTFTFIGVEGHAPKLEDLLRVLRTYVCLEQVSDREEKNLEMEISLYVNTYLRMALLPDPKGQKRQILILTRSKWLCDLGVAQI